MKEFQLTGTVTDWEKMRQFKAERWTEQIYGFYHCRVHSTFFKLEGDQKYGGTDADPCWFCYEEATTYLTGETT